MKKKIKLLFLVMILIALTFSITGCSVDMNYYYTLEDREIPATQASSNIVMEYGYIEDNDLIKDSLGKGEKALYVVFDIYDLPRTNEGVDLIDFYLQTDEGGYACAFYDIASRDEIPEGFSDVRNYVNLKINIKEGIDEDTDIDVYLVYFVPEKADVDYAVCYYDYKENNVLYPLTDDLLKSDK